MRERNVTHVTAEEAARRHHYCITITEVRDTLRRTLRVDPQYPVKNVHKAVCDHPEDGACCGAGGTFTEQQLTEINRRLGRGRQRAA